MPKPFDILSELGKFSAERKISLRDPTSASAFAAHVTHEVDRALADPALLQGQRAESMFEALLVSLGEFRLLKREDGGQVFPADRYVAPDFRIVLNDYTQWLIEVKNVYEPDPFAQSRTLLNPDYFGKLAAYAAATDGELKLAVFWARWSVWTVVSPEKLLDAAGGLTLDMMTAIRVNELAILGDRTIGTRAPLRLRLIADTDRTGPIGPDGQVKVVIGGLQIFSEDRELLDQIEREIAWTLIQHGQWKEQEPAPIIEGDQLLAIEYQYSPVEPRRSGIRHGREPQPYVRAVLRSPHSREPRRGAVEGTAAAEMVRPAYKFRLSEQSAPPVAFHASTKLWPF